MSCTLSYKTTCTGPSGRAGGIGLKGSKGQVGGTGATGATGIQVINRRVKRQAGCPGKLQYSKGIFTSSLRFLFLKLSPGVSYSNTIQYNTIETYRAPYVSKEIRDVAGDD